MVDALALLNKSTVVEKTVALQRKSDALVISGPADLPLGQELLKGAQSLAKYVEEQRQIAVRPLIDQKEEIDSLAKELSTPIKASLEVIKSKITAYNDKVEAERRAREAAIAKFRSNILSAKEESQVDLELAKLPFDDAALVLEASQRKSAIRQQKELDSERERQRQEEARLAEIRRTQDAKAAELEAERLKLENEKRAAAKKIEDDARKAAEERMKREASEASSKAAALESLNTPKGIRKINKFEVVNADLVPRKFLVPDDKLIRAAVNGGETSIPGVRIWVDTDVR